MLISKLAWGIALLGAAACGDSATECGTGTVRAGDVCELEAPLNPRCGTGTVWDSETGACQLEAPPLQCHEGTVEVTDEDGRQVCQCVLGR